MDFILYLVATSIAIIIATTFHEFTRAAVSTALGDPLPRERKRLTLNPLKHFEPVGFILMFAVGFGWGKPVDTSSYRYKNRKQGILLTAILPNVVNLIIAVIAAILSDAVSPTALVLQTILVSIYRYNVLLFVFNLFPVAPMDMVKVLSAVLPANKYYSYSMHEKTIQMVFLFILFLGWVDFIVTPIYGIITTFISFIL